MHFSLPLLALSALVGAAPLERTPIVTLPISKTSSGSSKALGHFDRTRAAEFVAGRYGKSRPPTAPPSGNTTSHASSNSNTTTPSSTASAPSVSATNALNTYTLAVKVGSTGQAFNLLIDTGSSNTWVGAGTTKYVPSNTSKATGDTVMVSYGSGQFSGKEYIDTVDLGSGLVIPQQSIGVATTAQGFTGVDGILGIGPLDLTEDTVSRTGTVPTVSDNLAQDGVIAQEVVGIYFAPATEDGTVNGELTFGGVDASKMTSSVNYVPITATSPASAYWGIDQTIAYGNTTLLTSSGIVDTGTTLLLIASDAFAAYQAAIPGSAVDQNSGLLEIPQSSVAAMQTMTFTIGAVGYAFTAQDQLLDQSLNTDYGGEEGKYYSVVADLGSPSGQGLDFINGYLFLERFYSVFDTTNSRVGFATTVNS